LKLPGDAIIASEKLTKYLLTKRPIGDKSEFLKRAGYTIDNWERLEQDIRIQILSKEAVPIQETEYGEYFEIRVPLIGPNGVTLNIRSVWMRESKGTITKFITLYPDKERAK
jgi:Domain of unknown function (DUF6883)